MKRFSFTGLLIALLLTTSPASADPDPKFAELYAAGAEALVAEADKRHNPFDDQIIEVELANSGESRVLRFTTITKGEKRAIKFSAPADLKGMGVVINGQDEIFVKVPDARKVRRVGTHAKRQSFQGTAFNMDDMAIIRFLDFFEIDKVVEETDTHVVIDLKRRSGVDLTYDALTIHVNKEFILVQQIDYKEGGKVIKRQTRSKPEKQDDGHVLFIKLEMEDIDAKKTTTSTVLEEEINTGVKDSTFGKRWLIRSL